jgi:DNA repair protein RAD16
LSTTPVEDIEEVDVSETISTRVSTKRTSVEAVYVEVKVEKSPKVSRNGRRMHF